MIQQEIDDNIITINFHPQTSAISYNNQSKNYKPMTLKPDDTVLNQIIHQILLQLILKLRTKTVTKAHRLHNYKTALPSIFNQCHKKESKSSTFKTILNINFIHIIPLLAIIFKIKKIEYPEIEKFN